MSISDVCFRVQETVKSKKVSGRRGAATDASRERSGFDSPNTDDSVFSVRPLREIHQSDWFGEAWTRSSSIEMCAYTVITATRTLATFGPLRSLSALLAHCRLSSLTVGPLRSLSALFANCWLSSLTVSYPCFLLALFAHLRLSLLTVDSLRSLSALFAHCWLSLFAHCRLSSLTVGSLRSLSALFAHCRLSSLTVGSRRSLSALSAGEGVAARVQLSGRVPGEPVGRRPGALRLRPQDPHHHPQPRHHAQGSVPVPVSCPFLEFSGTT